MASLKTLIQSNLNLSIDILKLSPEHQKTALENMVDSLEVATADKDDVLLYFMNIMANRIDQIKHERKIGEYKPVEAEIEIEIE